MNIDRSNLVNQLRAFALAGNGVVIGQPGVGKTHTMRVLRQQLRSDNVQHLLLPVDRLGSGSQAELQSLLDFEGDFILKLRQEKSGAKQPGILIFDGYDAARSENSRSEVFKLIRRAVRELRNDWNTIVSVRTFDAKKSQHLLELFPIVSVETGIMPIPCRQFLIPVLQEEEVEQALAQIHGLRALHNDGTPDFRTLLKVPFNLWLIEQVLHAGAKPNEFSKVTSEVQLLEMYWEYRVRKAANSKDREFILKNLTQKMVVDHTLTIRRDRVYQPDIREAWDALFSDETLIEVPGREVGVAFTHNILFDFAVSTHLLESEPNKLAAFVAEEPARPLFLRPSLVYHFTRLWHYDKVVFWRNFWSVVQREEMHLRQIVRLVLPAVIVNEAQTQEDLLPLLQQLRTNKPSAIDAIAFLLQALRILNSPKKGLWAEFLCLIGPHLDQRFAWDAGIIAAAIVESEDRNTKNTIQHCGDLGRKLLGWAWDSRKNSEQRQWFERLAGFVAIPLVAKTFASDPEESRKLLKNVIAVVGEPEYPVDCIYRLTNEVKLLIPQDPELVGMIYECVFGYEERSDEKTNIGGTVMPLISNRRQDYDMCRYCLIKEFKQFLASATFPAIKTGIRAVQAFAYRDHISAYLHGDKIAGERTFEFHFRNTNVQFIVDHSSIWDASSHPDQELQIADAVFEWLGIVAKSEQHENIDRFLNIFEAEAQMAFLWSRLLTVGANNPKVLGPRLWELAIATPVMEKADTLYQVGAFIEKAFEFLSETQRLRIEEMILNLGNTSDAEQKDYFHKYRARLIACIPKNLLSTEAGKQLRESLEKENNLPPNAPVFTVSSSWGRVTEEQILKQQGAKLESPVNSELRELYRPLREWEDKGKDETQIDGLVPKAIAVRDFISRDTGAEIAVLQQAWINLASFASDALRMSRDPKSTRFQELRKLVLDAANHPSPEPNPKYDSDWNSASWSPAPRNDAAPALPWLIAFCEDPEALALIQKLAFDPVPSVRFLLVCELWRLCENMQKAMWTIFDEIAEKEENGVVLQGVTVSLWNLIRRDKERSLALIQKLLKRVEEETDDDEKARTALVYMVVDYAVWHNDPWAKQTIISWQQEPLKYSASLATAGHRLIEHIKPQHSGSQLEQARAILLKHLDAVATGLCNLQKGDSKIPKEEIQVKWKALYGVIDNTVLRTYFAADVDSNLRQREEHPLSDEQRDKYFHDALPILEKVLSFGRQKETGMLLAQTAHYFMQLLNGVLRYDPQVVLRMASEVVICSKRFGYNLDSLAMSETVKLVESVLADHRESVQEEASVKNLLELLDAFVEAGWPDALNLVWRLDEIYR